MRLLDFDPILALELGSETHSFSTQLASNFGIARHRASACYIYKNGVAS